MGIPVRWSAVADTRLLLIGLVSIATTALASAQASAQSNKPRSPADWIRLTAERLCPSNPVSGLEAQVLLPDVWFLSEDIRRHRSGSVRTVRKFALPGGHELRVTRVTASSRLRRFTAEFHRLSGAKLQPFLQASTDPACQIRAGRRIVRELGSPNIWLEQLDGDLTTLRWRETLQAPWPSGRTANGVRVALIDSGLAYDLPIYRDRLARGPGGKPLGYDFWDLDRWPYDGDVTRGPFLPIRHGSAVASVLAREAPAAALIPLRYPRPDMSRMADVIERAAAAGARIVAMPLGSRKASDWITFETAARAHPELLIIASAGNDGRDLDKTPLWPAALSLDNLIVVTSADGFGRLAAGSNWGAKSVDIMLPAENIPVIDFRGAKGTASGSSYAVPRLTALAARLLEKRPRMTAAELKKEIFARAIQSPYAKDAVAVGWIPDPLQGER